MKPSTIIGLSILGFVVSLLGPAYIKYPVGWESLLSFVIGVIFWASAAGLIVGGWLSSTELRSYVEPYFTEEEDN